MIADICDARSVPKSRGKSDVFSGEASHFFLNQSKLRWAVEQAHIDCLAKDMSLDRFHYFRAGCKSIRARLYIELRVQCKEFKGVMVPRATGWSARTAIDLAARAQLVGTILQLSSL